MVGTAILFHCYYSFEFCVGKSSTALKVLVKFTIQISKFVSPLLHLCFCQWKEFDKIIFNRQLNCLNKNNIEQRGLKNSIFEALLDPDDDILNTDLTSYLASFDNKHVFFLSNAEKECTSHYLISHKQVRHLNKHMYIM